ncbi:MAG: low molecular weight protein arginine phosphatase [Candidatus Omnitrophica bacterium]|nr:low molecular weight protein arginine phosphatase [Candidatus Omnitrophota bacterium]
MSKIKKILVVCTGNSCRSVMAAGILKSLLKDKAGYEISTAGTVAVKGMQATPEAVEVAAEDGIDVSAHLSQPLTEEIIDQADLILVMQRKHREHILNIDPSAESKTHLLSEFGRMPGEDKLVDPNIPDPIGRSIDFYRQVYGIIKEGVLRTVNKLEER